MTRAKKPTEQRIGSGALLDLLDPDWTLIDLWVDVAQPAGRIGRFTSQAKRAHQYSVAEHEVIGAAVAYYETGSADLALAFLVHDAHESFFGDVATPITATLSRRVGPDLYVAMHRVKSSLDVAIARAAGTPVDYSREARRYVKDLDNRMFDAEAEALWREPRAGGKNVRSAPSNALRLALARSPARLASSVELVARRRTREARPIHLDLSHPWTADKAAKVWIACVRELRDLVI